jgi:chemotaxis protein MotA
MRFYIGIAVVISCVIIGFMASGGHISVLWQPFEFLIILGAAAGSYMIANPADVVSRTLPNIKKLIAGPQYHKKDYLILLNLLFSIFKLAKSKGMLALESHIENPSDSIIFQKFPVFLKNEKALNFLCDHLRLLTMGSENPHQMEDLMTQELEVIFEEDITDISALEKTADAMPALGIVAAVLGVIHTMGSISQPPEVLGELIGGALVGTFAGILISYGFIAPMSQSLKHVLEADQKYIMCIKSAILAYLNGNAPLIVVEYTRKILDHHQRPSFSELETSTQQAAEA